MTDQGQETRNRLESERRRLERLLEEMRPLRAQDEQADLSELSSADQHAADTGTETFNRERDLSIREQVEAELEEVREAVQRLAEGTYGTCQACGKAINPERLEVEPWARFCLDDQRGAEAEARSAL